MTTNTMNCLSSLIVLENLFGINRSYLIDSARIRIIGNTIFLLTSISLIGVGVNYILTENVSLGNRIFQTFLAVEFIELVITARVRKFSFEALKRLDEKCGITDDYISELKATSAKYTLITFFSALVDLISLRIIIQSLSEVVIFWVIYSAQDAELIFFSIIVETINLRLSKLKDVSPVFGSKVYRHVLITTALMNEEFTPRVLFLLAVMLGTTVTYSSAVMLTDTRSHLLIYLLWRESQALFCLWRVCYASSKSERICQQLAFQLAKSLTLDPALDKDKNPKAYRTVHRWYSTILSEKPRFVSGSVLSIGLSVPLYLLDLSVNYVLIIVQIYVAYN